MRNYMSFSPLWFLKTFFPKKVQKLWPFRNNSKTLMKNVPKQSKNPCFADSTKIIPTIYFCKRISRAYRYVKQHFPRQRRLISAYYKSSEIGWTRACTTYFMRKSRENYIIVTPFSGNRLGRNEYKAEKFAYIFRRESICIYACMLYVLKNL